MLRGWGATKQAGKAVGRDRPNEAGEQGCGERRTSGVTVSDRKASAVSAFCPMAAIPCRGYAQHSARAVSGAPGQPAGSALTGEQWPLLLKPCQARIAIRRQHCHARA